MRRQQMVHEQIGARGVSDARILRVFSEVPRHELVPAALRETAYEDRPRSPPASIFNSEGIVHRIGSVIVAVL